MLAPELTLASGALSLSLPSLSSGKLNSITHLRDREKQKTQSSEENPLPSARRLHMSPSTSVRLFFFFFFWLSDSFIQVEEEEKTIPESASSTFMKLAFFFLYNGDGWHIRHCLDPSVSKASIYGVIYAKDRTREERISLSVWSSSDDDDSSAR